MGSTTGAIWLAHDQQRMAASMADPADDAAEYQPWEVPGMLIERLSGESLAALAWAADCTVAELINRIVHA